MTDRDTATDGDRETDRDTATDGDRKRPGKAAKKFFNKIKI